jgi:hypothetical protein
MRLKNVSPTPHVFCDPRHHAAKGEVQISSRSATPVHACRSDNHSSCFSRGINLPQAVLPVHRHRNISLSAIDTSRIEGAQ